MQKQLTDSDAFVERLAGWLDAADAAADSRALDSDVISELSPRRVKLINDFIERRVGERHGMLRVLHDVTSIVNESRTTEAAFVRVLKSVAEHNGWCYGHVYIVSPRDRDTLKRAKAFYEAPPGRFSAFIGEARGIRLKRGQGLPGRVLATGEPAWETDVTRDLADRGMESAARLHVKSAVAFPAKVDDEVLAVFEFLSDAEACQDARFLDAMAGIGIQLGLFIVRKRMKRMIAELTTLEQQRIGRDLHDDLGQQLTGMALLAKSLERDLRDDASPNADRVAEIARGLKDAQTHVRMLARGLAPVEIDPKGLMKALADLAQTSASRFEIDVRFRSIVETLVRDSEIATELYRIAQEAVTNSAKHGRASEIVIELSSTEHETVLTVRDNGVGVSDAAIRKLGFGMSTMVYRANVIGGEFQIERGESGGTIVRCAVSLEDEVSEDDDSRGS